MLGSERAPDTSASRGIKAVLQRMRRYELIWHTSSWIFILARCAIRSKYNVNDRKIGGIVLVTIFLIDTVMQSMPLRSGKHRSQWPKRQADVCVIEEAPAVKDSKRYWSGNFINAGYDHRWHKDKGKDQQEFEDAASKSGGCVDRRIAMMKAVRRPQDG